MIFSFDLNILLCVLFFTSFLNLILMAEYHQAIDISAYINYNSIPMYSINYS